MVAEYLSISRYDYYLSLYSLVAGTAVTITEMKMTFGLRIWHGF